MAGLRLGLCVWAEQILLCQPFHLSLAENALPSRRRLPSSKSDHALDLYPLGRQDLETEAFRKGKGYLQREQEKDRLAE